MDALQIRASAPASTNGAADPSPAETARDARHLLSGVVDDAKQLVSNYGELFRHDFRVQLEHTRRALLAGFVAAHAAGAGLLLLALAGAHGLSLAFAWPLAASYAVVGAGVVAVAVGLFVVARRYSQAAERPAEVAAVEEAKEDIAWIQEKT